MNEFDGFEALTVWNCVNHILNLPTSIVMNLKIEWETRDRSFSAPNPIFLYLTPDQLFLPSEKMPRPSPVITESIQSLTYKVDVVGKN